MMLPFSEVTLCSVLPRRHLSFLRLNAKLIGSINPGFSTPWNFLYSDPQGRESTETTSHFEMSDAELTSVPEFKGCVSSEALETYIRSYTAPPNHPVSERLCSEFRAECAHSLGMEILLASVKTRFAVFIDCDFFVFAPDWIRRIIGHMSQRELTYFGAPWNPRVYHKPRAVPGTHFLIVDLQRTKINPGDFAPDWISQTLFQSSVWKNFHQSSSRKEKYKSVLFNPLGALVEDLRQRQTIGMSKEAGYRLWARLENNLEMECLVPCFDPNRERLRPVSTPPLSLLSRFDRFYPEKLRYFPRDWVTTYLGLADAELPSTRKRGGEEFYWRGNPFAARKGSSVQAEKERDLSLEESQKLLDQAWAWLRLPCST
jgi:hypothetical protein